MIAATFSIENLIEIVKTGGRLKTGVDVYNKKGTLLLGKNSVVESVRTLERLRLSGIRSVPVNSLLDGGLWDGLGNLVQIGSDGEIAYIPALPLKRRNPMASVTRQGISDDIEKRLLEIQRIKKEAIQTYDGAKKCLKKAFRQIQQTQGQFDVQAVESQVSGLVNFSVAADHPFPYLNREIFVYDDYLYQHSTNVCAIATDALHRFNFQFSHTVDAVLSENRTGAKKAVSHRQEDAKSNAFNYYYREDLTDISLGYFLHDIGKAMIPERLLNKSAGLTDKEFHIIKRHSLEYGAKILEANRIKNPVLSNIVRYHHAPLFENEEGCYPLDRDCSKIPPYVRICKLADVYDAMTSKRSYNEALNQVSAITRLFRKYVKKDPMLQFVLHAFVSSVGRYPPGSIVYLRNGQMAYVLETRGPLVIPFTDNRGKTLGGNPDPIDMGSPEAKMQWKIDVERSIKTPREVYNLLPSYIKNIALSA